MKHYILYSHDGSANHGCEALVRTTIALLQDNNSKFTLSSTHPEEDYHYGIDKLCEIKKIHSKANAAKHDLEFLKAYYRLKRKKDYEAMDNLLERIAFNAKKGDIAISIGGDSYCYGGTDEMAVRNKIWKQGGLRTVFWGCSIEPELLDNTEIAKDIASFDLITARETISYQALKKVNPNTILVNDSAFLLDSVKKPLPKGLTCGNIVGLNLSPLAEFSEKIPGIARKCYEKLIEYIINETDMNVLLIPHVIWDIHDDRLINNSFYEKYKHTNKVFKVEDANCEILKGYISECRFFVGARTHATIAAYSQMIPTLVLGYSVKAKGIARDLFGDENHYDMPVQQLKESDDLVEAFKWVEKHEISIKNHLLNTIPEYKTRINKAIEILNSY